MREKSALRAVLGMLRRGTGGHAREPTPPWGYAGTLSGAGIVNVTASCGNGIAYGITD
jgi:hypothetical protein